MPNAEKKALSEAFVEKVEQVAEPTRDAQVPKVDKTVTIGKTSH